MNLNKPMANAIHIMKILESGGSFPIIVGGAVRDLLIAENSKEPCNHKDVDIATSLSPEKILKIFSDAKIKILPIENSIDHGVVIVLYNNERIEIASLRKSEDYTNGHSHHADVSFSDIAYDGVISEPILEAVRTDLGRRDLTINAMSLDLLNNIYDPFDGKSDIQGKVVRFVGSPKDRILEDQIRALRFLRFGVKLDFRYDTANLAELLTHADMSRVSLERIGEEVVSILKSELPSRALDILFNRGVLSKSTNDIYRSIKLTNKQLARIDSLSGVNERLGSILEQFLGTPMASKAKSFPTIGKVISADKKFIKLMLDCLESSATMSGRRLSLNIVKNTIMEFDPHLKNKVIELLPIINRVESVLRAHDVEIEVSQDDIMTPVIKKQLLINGNELMTIGISQREIGLFMEVMLNKIAFNEMKNTRASIKKEALKYNTKESSIER